MGKVDGCLTVVITDTVFDMTVKLFIMVLVVHCRINDKIHGLKFFACLGEKFYVSPEYIEHSRVN